MAKFLTLDFLSRLIFGDDVFISYARSDGALYAASVAKKLYITS